METDLTTITKFTTDSGVLGDSITNDSALLLTGTTAANSAVKVYDGTTLLGSATANSSGVWSYTTGTLSDGTHSLTAAIDTGGSAGAPPTTFPNASTTGVRDGVTLTHVSGQFTSSYDGQIIEGIDADSIVINNANVVVRDCRAGHISANGPGVTIEYSDVYGKNSTNSVDLEGNNTTIRYCDISGSENGIWLEADGVRVENNYIHNLFSNNGNPDPHIDGIQVPGSNIGAAASENAIIRGNNIDLDNSTANACFTSMDAVNFDISNNRFNGGSYVLYFEGNGSGSQVVNNVFAQYTYGYSSGHAETLQTYSGNVTDKGVLLVQSASKQDLVPTVGTNSATTTSSITTDTSAPLSVTIDTKAPTAPAIASDTVNSANQVVVSGSAEANSTIKVYDGTTQVGTATTNSSGAWSLTTSALSIGSHALTAKATDAAGNVSVASSAVDAVIGSGSGSTGSGSTGSGSAGSGSVTAPVIASFSTDSGVAGDKITNDSTLELKGTAAAGSTVKVYDGTTQIGSTTADAAGSWDYITKVLTDAKHTLTATATNSSGQTSVASAAVAVTVDTKAPAAPTIARDTVNSSNQAVVSGSAEANSTIKVYDGTTQVGIATTNSSGAWSLTTSALSAGSHVLTAKATDLAGNVSAASAGVDPVIGSGTSGSTGSGTSGSGTSGTGTSGTGTTAPAAPKIASFSTDSGVAGDHTTNDKTLTLAGTAAANSTIKVFDGKTQLGTVTADANGAWHYSTAALPDGKHSLTATDTVSGVTSKASAAVDLTVDTAAPDAPVLLSDLTSHHRATVTGTAEAGSTIKVYEGTTLLGTAATGADGHFNVTTSGLKTGSHTFVASATDAAGNTSALSQPIDPPIGSHGGNGTSTVEVTNVRPHWDHTATIKGTADPNSQIKLFDGTTSVGSVTAGDNGKWSFHTSDLSGKTHAFTAEQVDKTGHVVGTSSGEAIIGTGRSNTLTGTSGNDIMVGKRGADTFEFASNFGHDVIKDFAARGPAHDTIELSKNVFDSFASVLSHAAQSGHDVVIATGNDTLTLKNTQLDKLNSHDFHFA